MTEERAPAAEDDTDAVVDDAPPPLLPDEPNRYAIPLTALVAGAYVGVTEQVEIHDEPFVPMPATGPSYGGGQYPGVYGDGADD